MRRVVLSLTVSALIVVATVRCGDVPETQYGSPSGLKSSNLPGEGGTVIQLTCDGGAALDGGPINPDGGKCPSWMNDIYPSMQPVGSWACASASCHSGPSTPPIDPAMASKAYTSLQAWKVTGPGGLQYINPASPDPAKSGIVCNLSGSCGQAMPRAPGKELTCTELSTVINWVRCGSPNN